MKKIGGMVAMLLLVPALSFGASLMDKEFEKFQQTNNGSTSVRVTLAPESSINITGNITANYITATADMVAKNITASGNISAAAITTSGTGQSVFNEGVVINEASGGASTDSFRVESNSYTSAFKVDAALDQINASVPFTGDSNITLYPSTISGYKYIYTTPNGTSISDAISSLNGVGGTIKLLPGIYNITSTLTIPENTTIIGSGNKTEVRYTTGNSAAPLFTITGSNVTLDNFYVNFTGTGGTRLLRTLNSGIQTFVGLVFKDLNIFFNDTSTTSSLIFSLNDTNADILNMNLYGEQQQATIVGIDVLAPTLATAPMLNIRNSNINVKGGSTNSHSTIAVQIWNGTGVKPVCNIYNSNIIAIENSSLSNVNGLKNINATVNAFYSTFQGSDADVNHTALGNGIINLTSCTLVNGLFDGKANTVRFYGTNAMNGAVVVGNCIGNITGGMIRYNSTAGFQRYNWTVGAGAWETF